MTKPETERSRPGSDTLAQLDTQAAQEAVAANLAFGHPGAGRPDDPGADMLEDQRTIANLHGS